MPHLLWNTHQSQLLPTWERMQVSSPTSCHGSNLRLSSPQSSRSSSACFVASVVLHEPTLTAEEGTLPTSCGVESNSLEARVGIAGPWHLARDWCLCHSDTATMQCHPSARGRGLTAKFSQSTLEDLGHN